MKILFYRYGSICEPDIIEAFGELGHTVCEIDTEIYDKNYPMQESVQNVNEYIQREQPDCVFSINFYPMLSEICRIYHLRYISWVVSDPILELYSSTIKNEYNRIFIFDHVLCSAIAPFNPDNIFYLPLATNLSSKQKAIASAQADFKKSCSSDISFIGSLYTEKTPWNSIKNLSMHTQGYLDGIMNSQLKIYGYYFIEELLTNEIVAEIKKCCPDFYTITESSLLTKKCLIAQYYIGSRLTAIERTETMRLLSENFPVTIYTKSDTSSLPGLSNRGTAKTLTEMPVIFHESHINLNITSRSIRSGIPLRVWDIMGSGGFVLSNYQNEIPVYFEPGQHLDTYGSLEELVEKCNYYLSHDSLRKEIAENGLNEIRQKHTYPIRIQKLLATAFSH